MARQERFAIAFVHIPTGEVGRSEFMFTTKQGAQEVCNELDGICDTILHFVLGERDDIRILAKERKGKHVANLK